MTTETLPAVVPLEPTTPIKPSEAIRLGCLIAPVQGQGEFFSGVQTACALGAMALGLGYSGERREGYLPDAQQFVRQALGGHELRFLDPYGQPVDGVDAVWMRNDIGWSRERIADWLAGLGL